MEIIKLVSDNKNKIVTRRNELIEARYRLGVQEQRIMLWVLSSIEPEDDGLKTYRVNIKDLAKTIGIKNKDIYRQLRKTTKKLMSRIIEIQEEGKLVQAGLINKATYYKGKGYVDIRIDEDLKKYLLQLKNNFTSIRIKYAFQLPSIYSLRVYELLIQYQRIGERIITVKDLRFMLDITPEKYKVWSNFESRVLKKSQKEINSKTDISFKYEKIKTGRRITAIKFIILKGDIQRKLPWPEVERKPELEELISYGLTPQKAEEFLKSKPEKTKEALDAIQNNKQDLKNPAGWIIKFIQEDWVDSVGKEKEKKKGEIIRENEEKRAAEIKAREQEKQEQLYSDYQKDKMKSFIENLSVKEEEILRNEFQQYLQNEGVSTKLGDFTNNKIWLKMLFFYDGIKFLKEKNLLDIKNKGNFISGL